MKLSFLCISLLYPMILAQYCIHNGMFRVGKLTKDLSKRIGVHRLCKNDQWKSSGAERSLLHLGRYAALDRRGRFSKLKIISGIVQRLVTITPSTQVYKDHQEHEMLIFLFELTCHVMFSCTPGWIMKLPVEEREEKGMKRE